jgi:hypothetical protein
MSGGSFGADLKRAIRGAFEVVLMVVPVSVVAAILRHLGLIDSLARVLEPITGLMGLPSRTAPAIVGAALCNFYVGIALSAPLGLSPHEWTCLGVWCSLVHSMPVESLLARRFGIPIGRGISMRLAVGLLLTRLVSVLPPELFGGAHPLAPAVAAEPAASEMTGVILAAIRDSVRTAAGIVAIAVGCAVAGRVAVRAVVRGRTDSLPALIPVTSGLAAGINYGTVFFIDALPALAHHPTQHRMSAALILVCHGLPEETLVFAIQGAHGPTVLLGRIVSAIGAIAVSAWLVPRTPPVPDRESPDRTR